jgi:DNA (cytosine-5)-methyltransferase 1
LVPEATKKGYAVAVDGDSVDLSFPNSKTRRGRVGDKVKNLMTSQNIGVYTQGEIRKLTPIECERLQGLPDNYTEGVSNTQRYKALGNAFNVDVVAHILSFIK